MNKPGKWTNGKRTITGWWDYYWPADRFDIRLNSKDRINGFARSFSTHGDKPEWGNWKLVPDYIEVGNPVNPQS